MRNSAHSSFVRIARFIQNAIEVALRTTCVRTVIPPRSRRRDLPEISVNRNPRSLQFRYRKRPALRAPQKPWNEQEWSFYVFVWDLRIYVELYNMTVREERAVVRALKQLADHSTRVISVSVIRNTDLSKRAHFTKYSIIPCRPRR